MNTKISPTFKHCIDFLNGDAETQESTEQQPLEVISNYKIYPIADNETPKLSADRLEYTFMNCNNFIECEEYKTFLM